MIGSDNPQFISGETDLRGVFVAEGVRGLVTAVARKGDAQYAFYRGTSYVGQPPACWHRAAGERCRAPAAATRQPGQNQSLDANLKMQNTANSIRQIERLQQRYISRPTRARARPPAGSVDLLEARRRRVITVGDRLSRPTNPRRTGARHPMMRAVLSGMLILAWMTPVRAGAIAKAGNVAA